MIKIIDDRRNALIFHENLLIPYLVDHFYHELEKNIKKKNRFNVALAGGSTPKKLYQAIAKDPRAHHASWSKVYVYYGDERAVALDHEDSNYRMSLDAGFKNLLKINLFPMLAHLKEQSACIAYEKQLPPHLDLIFLGMGDDGHTASLFPNDPLCLVSDAKVAFGYIESKQAYRMTLTFPYINASSQILVLIVGNSKKEKVQEVLSPLGAHNPCYHIGTKTHKACFVLDDEAAKLL